MSESTSSTAAIPQNTDASTTPYWKAGPLVRRSAKRPSYQYAPTSAHGDVLRDVNLNPADAPAMWTWLPLVSPGRRDREEDVASHLRQLNTLAERLRHEAAVRAVRKAAAVAHEDVSDPEAGIRCELPRPVRGRQAELKSTLPPRPGPTEENGSGMGARR